MMRSLQELTNNSFERKECDIYFRGVSKHTLTLLHIFMGDKTPTPQDLRPHVFR